MAVNSCGRHGLGSCVMVLKAKPLSNQHLRQVKQQDLTALNRNSWDIRTRLHVASKFYAVDEWLLGADSLKPPEIELLGDVHDKRILHLQCHFGQDTGSLVRRGAIATGVDFSPSAIAEAHRLSAEAEITVTFVESDVLEADTHPTLVAQAQTFDIVYASYGTVGWLHDLNRWAEVISYFLKPGGKLVFVEFHPFYEMTGPGGFEVVHSYFGCGPTVEEEPTYTDTSEEVLLSTAFWDHPVSSVMTALLQAKLDVVSFQEYDYMPYDLAGDRGVEVAPGKWQLLGMEGKVPLVYSIVCQKRLA